MSQKSSEELMSTVRSWSGTSDLLSFRLTEWVGCSGHSVRDRREVMLAEGRYKLKSWERSERMRLCDECGHDGFSGSTFVDR